MRLAFSRSERSEMIRPRVDSNSTHSLGGLPESRMVERTAISKAPRAQRVGSGSCPGLASMSRPMGVDRPAALTKWFAT